MGRARNKLGLLTEHLSIVENMSGNWPGISPLKKEEEKKEFKQNTRHPVVLN